MMADMTATYRAFGLQLALDLWGVCTARVGSSELLCYISCFEDALTRQTLSERYHSGHQLNMRVTQSAAQYIVLLFASDVKIGVQRMFAEGWGNEKGTKGSRGAVKATVKRP